MDGAQLVTELRAAHCAGDKEAGLDTNQGTIGNMIEMGVIEAHKVKRHVLISAAEAAEMIL